MAEQEARFLVVTRWLWAHRRKVTAAVIVLMPLVTRVVPGFPSDTVVDALRTYFGA